MEGENLPFLRRTFSEVGLYTICQYLVTCHMGHMAPGWRGAERGVGKRN